MLVILTILELSASGSTGRVNKVGSIITSSDLLLSGSWARTVDIVDCTLRLAFNKQGTEQVVYLGIFMVSAHRKIPTFP